MSEQLNLDRKPTKLDREILAYLEQGAWLSHIEVLNKFKSTCSRDHFWRLKKAGYPIKDQMVTYTTAEGKTKKYKMYYIHEPKILPAGAKVERIYKPKEKTAIDHANAIIKQTSKKSTSENFAKLF
jgi:hypothetical protein